jgi:hypothetical protein
MGGGGRYNVILEFKGSKLKKFEKEKEKIYMRKREKYELCKNKIKRTPRFSKVH